MCFKILPLSEFYSVVPSAIVIQKKTEGMGQRITTLPENQKIYGGVPLKSLECI